MPVKMSVKKFLEELHKQLTLYNAEYNKFLDKKEKSILELVEDLGISRPKLQLEIKPEIKLEIESKNASINEHSSQSSTQRQQNNFTRGR